MDTLDDLGLDQDTLVIVTSDNGGVAKWHDSNGGLRGFKASVFEGGIRVPMMARWPGVIQPASTNDSVIASFDFFPTIAELVRADVSDLSLKGESFVKVLLDGTHKPRRETLFWEAKLSHRYLSTSSGILNTFAVRTGDWKLLFEDDTYYLFDMSNDPSETVNLAQWNPGTIQELSNAYAAWRLETGRIDYAIHSTKGNVQIRDDTLKFNRKGSIQLRQNSLFDFHDGDFTLTAALTPTEIGRKMLIARKPGSWKMLLTRYGKLKLRVKGIEGTATVLRSGTRLRGGQTSNVAFAVFGWRESPSTIRLHVDGELEGESNEIEAVQPGDRPVRFGRNRGHGFVGTISDLEFYTSSLTREELVRAR